MSDTFAPAAAPESSTALSVEVSSLIDNAALLYLASLHSANSRYTVGAKLNVVARMLGYRSLADCPWHEMRASHLVALVAALSKDKVGSTVNTYLAALKGVARAAWRAEQISHEELLRILDVKSLRCYREPAGRSLRLDETRDLIRACEGDGPTKARDLAMVLVFLGSGLRRAEVASLNLADYDRVEQTLTVVGKGDKERTVFLPETAVEALNDWIDRYRGPEAGALFCRILKGTHRIVTASNLQPRSVSWIMQTYMENISNRKFSTHDFRRTFATRLLSQNVDISVVKGMMGHANIATTARYDRRGDEAKKKAAKNVIF